MRLNLPPVLVAAGALIAREAYEAVAAPARCAPVGPAWSPQWRRLHG
jgi:hypothetical protein